MYTISIEKINTYDKKNRITHSFINDYIDENGTEFNSWETIIKYDENGNKIYYKHWCPKTGYIDEEHKTEYNNLNLPIYTKSVTCNDKYEDWFKYDENENKIYHKHSGKYGIFEYEYLYENNLLIKEKSITNNEVLKEYKYDSNGREIECIDDDWIYRTSYDNDGSIVKLSYCIDDPNGEYCINKYDQNDNLVVNEEYENYMLIEANYYTYSKSGKIITQINDKGKIKYQGIYDENDLVIGCNYGDEYHIYKYDDHNNMTDIHCIFERDGNKIYEHTKITNIYE